ncbi:MAG TPA: MopE-related protein [Polyangiales bacterium]
MELLTDEPDASIDTARKADEKDAGSMSCVPSNVTDLTCNGVDDDCDGTKDEDYVAQPTSCGRGVCAASGVTVCTAGNIQDSCTPLAPRATTDATCDGLDDDCNGIADEDFSPVPSQCGVGACAATGSRVCSAGVQVDMCTPGAPAAADDNSGTLGVDDDCDGQVDEDVVCSDPNMRLAAGAHANIVISPECTTVTVRLWGGGGAAGQNIGSAGDVGGHGGGGGYATKTFSIGASSRLDVHVGAGSPGCRTAGANAGSTAYRGGTGGAGTGTGNPGTDGADGVVSGGGNGQAPTGAPRGGKGYYGGGGAGSGGTGTGAFSGTLGDGGGGGAATVALVDGVVIAVAGGGGGGGGASGNYSDIPASTGGAGGAGCGGNASGASTGGGGGGGGGACSGDTTHAATGRDPYDPANDLSGEARGGLANCGGGTGGYAVLSFSR